MGLIWDHYEWNVNRVMSGGGAGVIFLGGVI
jgi:hypothetical protein